MADVIFFASIRETLDCERIQIDLAENSRLSDLISQLVSDRGESWRETLTAENVRVAVNQELITGNPMLQPGDEIAFFPPVTGG